MQHLTILTGASRGMGLAMARQLCHPNARLLCISRSTRPDLESWQHGQGADLTQWRADLAEPIALAHRRARR